MKPKVKRFRTGAAMAAYAAEIFRAALLKKRGRFLAAVSGGKTPARLFRRLAALPLPWERAVFFLADERLVPRSSEQSNFGAAYRALFSKLNLPAGGLRPVKPGPRAAAAYEKDLLKETGKPGGLDLVFLGLGEDGHTASLFPGSPALEEKKRLVLAVKAPAGLKPSRRVTLTLQALNRARTIVLLAAGPGKKKVFEAAARRDRTIPAGRLSPRGALYLLFSARQ